MWRLQEIICVVRQSQILHSQHLEAKWRRGCRHCSDHVVHRGWCVAVLTHIFKVNQLQGNPSADCAQFSRTVCESRRVVTQVLPQPNFYYKLTQFGSIHSLGSCFYASFYFKMSNWQTQFTNLSEMSHIQRESDTRHRKNEARMIYNNFFLKSVKEEVVQTTEGWSQSRTTNSSLKEFTERSKFNAAKTKCAFQSQREVQGWDSLKGIKEGGVITIVK